MFFSFRTAGAFIGSLIITTAIALPANADLATQKVLTANYALRCTVYAPNSANRDVVSSFLSPQFVGINPNGRQFGRDEFLDQGRQELRSVSVTGCYYTFGSFSLPDADTVVVTTTLHLEGTLRKLGAPHTVVAIEQSQDTWIRTPEAWLLRLSAISRILLKLDGTVVQDIGS